LHEKRFLDSRISKVDKKIWPDKNNKTIYPKKAIETGLEIIANRDMFWAGIDNPYKTTIIRARENRVRGSCGGVVWRKLCGLLP
jgi:hypothetical protein